MRTGAFYPAAVVLAIIALVLNLAGRDQSVRASQHRAMTIAAAYGHDANYVPDAEAARLVHNGHVISAIGIAFTALAFAGGTVALFRHEKGWYLILAGLLASDLMALMLL
jgi:hypothetical protein